MSKFIYRVYLPSELQNLMEGTYPIGCKSSITGFWTKSKKDAVLIYFYLLSMYSSETANDKILNRIIETPISNVKLSEDYQYMKTDDNPLFDKNEVFTKEILDFKKITDKTEEIVDFENSCSK